MSSSATPKRRPTNAQAASRTFVPVPPCLWPQDIDECADLPEQWGRRGISLVWSIEPTSGGSETTFEPRLEAMHVQQETEFVPTHPVGPRLSDEERSFIRSVADALGREWASAMMSDGQEKIP